MLTETATNKYFFERTKEKTILKERIKAFASGFRQNIAIIGRPYIGKTCLIESILPDIISQKIIAVYADVRDEPFDFFCHRFIGSLLYQYLGLKSSSAQKDDLKGLVKECRRQLPKTVEAAGKIDELVRKKDFDQAYDLLLDLPRFLQSESGISCAIILEEFNNLPGYKLMSAFSVLGKKIMAQRYTFYILSSSSVLQARHILAEKLQLLFGNFEIIELEEFDFSTSRNFLLDRLSGFNIAEQYAKFLINFTNGHPFYLDVITNKLKSLLLQNKKQRVTTELLETALDEILFYTSGELYQHFTNIINVNCRNTNGVDILSILTLISEGNTRTRDLVSNLNSSSKSINHAISDLESAGLIEKIGVFNKIDDSVLRFWLKTVCHKRRVDFTSDPVYRKKAFISNLKKASADFTRSSKEDLYEKIVNLFKSFSDDLVEVDQKKYVLPTFADVAARVIGENGPYIICHSKGKNWICQIRERRVTEKQVLDFIKDARAGKYKFQRKVLIVIDGMDDNAKLLAKGANVWSWNLKTLNTLLDLYGKHKVIKLQ